MKPKKPRKKEFRLSDLKRAMEVLNALGLAVRIQIAPIEMEQKTMGFIQKPKEGENP